MLSKKVELAKKEVRDKCLCKNKVSACFKCKSFERLIELMATAEIPVDYWFRTMEKFYGLKSVKEDVMKVIKNIDDFYNKGETLYLAGERGRGKTLSSCSILKKALMAGYTAYYITLSDLIAKTTTNSRFKLEIKNIDFIVIDEVDNRFFPTEGSMELYGGQLESILRSRMQNKLPTILCSNATDIGLVFKGQYKTSFQSLWSQFVKTIYVGGSDARKGEEKIDES